MSTAENKALVRRVIEEVVNGGELGLVDELFAPGFVANGRVLDPERVRQTIARHHAGFRGYRATIEDLIAEGDAVAVRVVLRGTPTGEGRIVGISVPETATEATWTGIGILRVAGGRLAEETAVYDRLGLLQQLGGVPAPGQRRP
jgi:predicted ester cyclase